MEQRLDARAAASEVHAADDELALQYRRLFPNVELGFASERNDRRALPGRDLLADTARASVAAGRLTAPTIASRGQRAQARRQIIDAKLGPSLAVTLPIWDQNQAQIAKARIRSIQKRTQYERILDSIALQISDASNRAQTAAELVRFHREQGLPLAESTVDGAKRRYEAGESGVLELVEAQETLVQRRRDLVGALRDYAVALAELESAVGGRLPAGRSADSTTKENSDATNTP
jgi:outer membrane protein TolC